MSCGRRCSSVSPAAASGGAAASPASPASPAVRRRLARCARRCPACLHERVHLALQRRRDGTLLASRPRSKRQLGAPLAPPRRAFERDARLPGLWVVRGGSWVERSRFSGPEGFHTTCRKYLDVFCG